ncbi:cytochrome P450 monooxygenase [Fomitopsis betulina]|nr:cytochrome P450 monooxygenase [Fomitopsis betulina]
MYFVDLLIKSLLILITTRLVWWVAQRGLRKAPLDNLPGPAPAPWLMGHLQKWLDRNGIEFHRQIAQDYGPVKPMLYIYDLRALDTMMIRQPTIYEQENLFMKVTSLLYGPSLISVVGNQHRKQRKMLNPAFSTAHMRDMLPTFYSITYKAHGPKGLDVLKWMGRTVFEAIVQGGIGVSVDSLAEDTTHELAKAVKDLVPTLYGLGFLYLIPHISKIGPAWLRRLLKLKNIIDSMEHESFKIYEDKKATLLQGKLETSKQIAEGKDILGLLIRANMAASEADKLSEDEVIAQMSLILFAATDTTATSMVKTLERLAQNEGFQEKLRKELVKAQRDRGHLSYDELMRLPILDATVRETLRTPIRDVILPFSEPIHGRDGTLLRELPVLKGTDIVIGALWGDDANEWKPERWLVPPPSALTEVSIPAVYTNVMMFLGGGRLCIGFKFAELKMKVILSVLLSTFKFEMATDKHIFWNVTSVQYPTVGKESNVPEMPMKVSML